METIIVLALVILAIWVLVKFVLPVAGVVALVILGIGMVYAFVMSIISFFSSLAANINPYRTYQDNSPQAQAGARRGYFFGPGYHQIGQIVSGAFANQKRHLVKIAVWKANFTAAHSWLLNMWVWLFYIAAALFVYVFGSIWVSIFSVILCTVILAFTPVFFILFSILWILDRNALLLHSIHSRCPNCKRKSVVPLFECPDCGTQHPKLTPGSYGTFRRKCNCGRSLPTTIFNGRGRLRAACPYCGTALAAGGATQFGIQLVGNTASGKTTFLAAFWHNYLEKVSSAVGVTYRCFPPEAFIDLEDQFQSGWSNATSEFNSQMYSLVREQKGKTPLQMTIYDVAGEAFESLDQSVQQQQFKYCEGFVLVVDPTAPASDADDCISSFVVEMRKLKGHRASQLSTTPVAVVISKADVFKREIGLPKIQSSSRSGEYSAAGSPEAAFEAARNAACRNFLIDHGFDTTVNMIDSEFANVNYYPISAMGHEADGTPYEPWGVEAPVEWIMAQSEFFGR